MKNRKLAKCQEGAEFRGSISSVKRNERKRERGGGKIRSRADRREGGGSRIASVRSRGGRLVLVHISFFDRRRPISCWNFVV